jgi:hypothetical protein
LKKNRKRQKRRFYHRIVFGVWHTKLLVRSYRDLQGPFFTQGKNLFFYEKKIMGFFQRKNLKHFFFENVFLKDEKEKKN